MRFLPALVLYALCIHVLAAFGQDSPQEQTPPNCVTDKCIRCGFPKAPFRFRKNESFKGALIVKYEIGEDGTVSDARVSPSSGVADIDKNVLAAVSGWKYKPRAGCAQVKTEMAVAIDWK
jgi:TonB family protein